MSAPRPDARNAGPRPLLATGRAAAAVGGREGRLALPRESRGAVLEWGGVYAAGVRLTGPWTIRLVTPQAVLELPAPGATFDAGEGSWTLVHEAPPWTIRETVAVAPDLPAVGRELVLTTSGTATDRILVESDFAPYLAPVLVEGVKPYEYEARTRGTTLEVRSHGCGLGLDSAPLPSHWALNGASWIGGRWTGELGNIMSDHEITVTPDRPATVRWVVWGGLEHALRRDPGLGARMVGEAGWREAAEGPRAAWRATTPTLRFPQAPGLERAYERAVRALRMLYTAPDPEITGLVAGYPWYASVWFRDLAWMLPAVIWLGDLDWAARSLRTAFRFQARRDLPVLGAANGEIPMQVSPGPIFLFGTSDTTLHYPGLVHRWTCHSGSDVLATELADGVAAAVGWGRAKVDPATGWLRHGGEVGEIDRATRSIGSIHYGFDAPDTTIWDSADRRDHAIDIQALWIAALEASADLGTGRGSVPPPEALRAEAARLRERLTEFRWPEEEYLVDSMRLDGTPVRRLRPNALRAVSQGLLPAELASTVVRRAARDDLSTPWGVRTLASGDPEYDPQAYHGGQVWPIATAWLADAALAVGESDIAHRALNTIAEMFEEEEGLAAECYRGDRDEPFDACFLLGFSVAPFLTTLFERLWGLRVGPGAASLTIDPRFPPGWDHASLGRLRVGDGLLDLEWSPSGVEARWSGDRPLELVGAADRVVLPARGSATLAPAPSRPKGS